MADEAEHALPEPRKLSRRRPILLQPRSPRAGFRADRPLTADPSVPMRSRGPLYGLTDKQTNAAAAELTNDVRIAVSGIDASHAAEDDVNADGANVIVCGNGAALWTGLTG